MIEGAVHLYKNVYMYMGSIEKMAKLEKNPNPLVFCVKFFTVVMVSSHHEMNFKK